MEDYAEHIVPLFERYPELDQKKMSLEAWMKAASLVTSRAFQVDEYHGESLVPFADLFNHRPENEHVHFTTLSEVCSECGLGDCACGEDGWEDSSAADEEMAGSDDDEVPEAVPIAEEEMASNHDKDDILEMIVHYQIEAGEEVYNTYGQQSNANLLRLYGFCEQKNPHSYISVDRKELFNHR